MTGKQERGAARSVERPRSRIPPLAIVFKRDNERCRASLPSRSLATELTLTPSPSRRSWATCCTWRRWARFACSTRPPSRRSSPSAAAGTRAPSTGTFCRYHTRLPADPSLACQLAELQSGDRLTGISFAKRYERKRYERKRHERKRHERKRYERKRYERKTCLIPRRCSGGRRTQARTANSTSMLRPVAHRWSLC
eukprot:8119478-Pyramimonas_sp.AAC.1